MGVVAVLAATAAIGGVGAAQGTAPSISSKRTPPGIEFRTRQAGWTVWSEEIKGRWWLLGSNSGRTRVLNAPSSSRSHDPGVGRGRDKRPTVVYQLCGQSTCTLWSLRLPNGTPRELTWVGPVRRYSSAASAVDQAERETHPRISGGLVAFQTRIDRRWRYTVAPSDKPGARRTYAFGPSAGEIVGTVGGADNLALGPKHLMAHWDMRKCGSYNWACGRMDVVGLASGRSRTVVQGSADGECSSEVYDLQSDGATFSYLVEAMADDSGSVDCPMFQRRKTFRP